MGKGRGGCKGLGGGLGCPQVGSVRVSVQPKTDSIMSGCWTEDPPPIAKNHGSSRIGLGWMVVKSNFDRKTEIKD